MAKTRHESFVKISWTLIFKAENEFLNHNQCLSDLSNRNYSYYKDNLIRPVLITFYGLDSFMDYYITDVGHDFIDSIAQAFIIDYINKSLLPPNIGTKSVDTIINWKSPEEGNFLMLYLVSTAKDWDGEYELDVECKGIIGEQVKLSY